MPKRILLSLAIGLFSVFAPLLLPAQTSPVDDFKEGTEAYNLGNFQEALIHFEAALNNHPDDWQAYEQEGYCYFHLDQRKEMNEAFSQSLRLHPDNPALISFLNQTGDSQSPSGATPVPNPTPIPVSNPAPVPPDNPSPNPNVVPAPNPAPPPSAESSFPTKPWPKSPAPNPAPAPSSRPEQEKWASSSWLNLSGAFSFGALGDLNNAANLWNQQISQFNAQGSASVANLGYQFALEGGSTLDKTNAFSLQAGFETGHGFQEHLVYSSPLTLGINPQLFTFGANYYRYFPGKDSRFILTCGVVFGLAVVDYYQDDPIETIRGPLSGTGVGFNAGLGEEWRVSSNIGFQVIGRFRYLSISQLQNNFNVSGVGSGQGVLATDSQGDLGLATQQEIGQNGLRYAVMDYTGFNLDFSFNFYLF